MATSVKRLIVGRALRTEQAAHERLSKLTALAVFSSDALSSTAYATEEILLVLAVAVAYGQTHAFQYVIPISLAIAALLAIVAISYRQTIHAYPSGGGAYIVAKENLGTTPGLIAAASLLVDYVLTVSVSIAAGVAALTSAVQGTRFAWLDDHKVALGLFFIVLIALANLRGVRESGALFAVPTYVFIVSFLFMIGYGLFHYLKFGGAAPAPGENLALAVGYHAQPLTLFLLLGAFSNGCSALTGVEAISNGIPAFKAPEARNASTTLVWMAVLLTTMFLGTSLMAYLYGVHPNASETVISQFARIMFTGPLSWCYYLVQAATAAILVLAANTSFADFPRLGSLLARDRFLPRQFANRGDRLVFSNGIVILALFSSLLVVAFAGDTSRLIPLYAVGVFLSFTLSQAGMVRHWLAERDKGHAQAANAATAAGAARQPLPDVALAVEQQQQSHFVHDEVTAPASWKKSIVINGVGAIATAIVLAVFIVTKFIHGAWIVVVVIPLLVLLFKAIHEHYRNVARQLTIEGVEPLHEVNHAVIVPISGIHRGVINALQYAKSIAPNNVTAVYVDFDEQATALLRKNWEQWNFGVNLVVLPSPYRELTAPLLRYIHRVDRKRDDDIVTVIIPEFVPAKWWQHLLHNQSSLLLKGALLFKQGVIVVNVPYHLKH
ncbi:MAG: APC family permease [Acidobacteria bacterium]|nr:APC family permease [Acidobacteriota bacterium]MBI3421781.1 APC family permease [Acidobacteriota bacterium]